MIRGVVHSLILLSGLCSSSTSNLLVSADLLSHQSQSTCKSSVTGGSLLQLKYSEPTLSGELSERTVVGSISFGERLGGIGETATLDETGYQEVIGNCCTRDMIDYIKRIVEEEDMKVCGLGWVAGVAYWYDCVDDNKTYAILIDNIRRGAEGPCPGLAAKGDDCREMASSCPRVFSGTIPPCDATTTSPSSTTTSPPTTTMTEPTSTTTLSPTTTSPSTTTTKPTTTTTSSPTTTATPTPTPPPPPPYKFLSAINWGKGECTNKPSKCTTLGSGLSSTTACGQRCKGKTGGCCYYKPGGSTAGGLCKWCSGAFGDNAGAGGRYQCIVPLNDA